MGKSYIFFLLHPPTAIGLLESIRYAMQTLYHFGRLQSISDSSTAKNEKEQGRSIDAILSD